MTAAWDRTDDLIEAAKRVVWPVYVRALEKQSQGEDGADEWREYARILTRVLIIGQLLGRESAIELLRSQGESITIENEPIDDHRMDQYADRESDLVIAPFTDALNEFLERVPNIRLIVDRMSREQRQRAFWITGVEASTSLRRIQKQLGETLEARGGIRAFIGAVRDDPAVANLTLQRLETVYRTNVMSALNRGTQEQLREPAVRGAVALLELNEIRDRRTRGAPGGRYKGFHWQMDGFVETPDHPVWNVITPPNGYQCRATVSPMTWLQARRRGFADEHKALNREAIDRHNGEKWAILRSGRYPDAGF